MADQFIREGQMGAKLRHPNIVPIYEVHSEKRMHYMVMDFIEGRNLREFIQVRKSLSPEEAIKFMIDITSGLAYAAGMGVYHRDLKLSNVLMSSTGRAQLVDFGLAAVTSGAEGDVGEMVNPRTIDYAGLERATGVRKDDPRSDIYFAGCIFYHLLSGHAPLPETRDRAQRLSRSRFENVVPINQRVPDLPRRVAAIVQKAMELNVDRRFQTAAEFLADLQATARRLKGDTEGDNAIVIDEGQDRAVLIVDSNAEVQNALRTALRKLGYRVLVVSDSQRALDRLNTRERVADCVVIGCHSLGKAGLECFNQLALSEQTRRTPAILMLAEKQRPWAQHAKLSDTRVIANMPLKMREFRTLLRDVLKRAANGRSA